ncbi:FAD binding domain-containing protein [Fodinibacter luteus]|uniref:FAD binding domain-containing protein n=1 Tax=Fodinibacter luteus TaxID=552064 RepID=A0ABP8KNB9_9MICO
MAAGRHEVTVNGTARSLAGTDPATSALDFLRAQGLTGAKEGCAEGECGACAVLVLRPDGVGRGGAGADGGTDGSDGTAGADLGRSRWTGVNACLVPAAALDGQEVLTAEGLGTPDALHPVQHELAVRGGSQCGYCTPGFVCAMAAEYYRGDRHPHAVPDREHGPNGFDLHALSGNLCRCTGYRPIRDAAFALGAPEAGDPLASRATHPPPAAPPSRLEGASGAFERATDLSRLLTLLREHPDAVLVAGATDWGVEVNLRGARARLAVGIDRVHELRALHVGHDAVEIGASLTLSEVGRALAGRVPLLDQLLPQFASPLIRNGATLGGNLATASPVGDAAPALLALEADVVLACAGGERTVPLSGYFTGYRRTVRRPDEVIRAVRIPLPLSGVTAFHKVAKRRFDDISSVAAGIALDVRDGVVAKARIGLGGVAATPVRALATEAALEGRPWTAEVVRAAAQVMGREGTPIDDHRASAAYRSAMLGTALLRLHAEADPSLAPAVAP